MQMRYCRSPHATAPRTVSRFPADPPTMPRPWLALAGWLLPNTVSLDISFSSREHVTRCSLGRATRWACSVRFSTHGGALGNHAAPPFLSWPPVRGRCGLCCGESRVGRAVVVTATHARSGRLPRGFTRTGTRRRAMHATVLGWCAVASAGSWRLPMGHAARRGEM